jgi:hypothetical protein
LRLCVRFIFVLFLRLLCLFAAIDLPVTVS